MVAFAAYVITVDIIIRGQLRQRCGHSMLWQGGGHMLCHHRNMCVGTCSVCRRHGLGMVCAQHVLMLDMHKAYNNGCIAVHPCCAANSTVPYCALHSQPSAGPMARHCAPVPSPVNIMSTVPEKLMPLCLSGIKRW